MNGYFVDNVELKNEEVTVEGFIELNQMEAEENQGDTDDLWLTLSAMGYNRALGLDEVGNNKCMDSSLEIVWWILWENSFDNLWNFSDLICQSWI